MCNAIAKILDAPWDFRAEISLGARAELEGDECSHHQDLFPKTNPPSDVLEKILLRKPARQSLLYVVPDLYRYQPNRMMLEAPWESLMAEAQDNDAAVRSEARAQGNTLMVNGTAVVRQDSTARPRLVNPDYIDIGLLQEWLLTCREQHQEKCGAAEFQHNSQARPALLIDVTDNCLVDGTGFSPEYVALSYVWGRTNQFFTTVENLERLIVPNSLEHIRSIPQTIKQAVALTEALGSRYLWVDALCIVQDHESQQEQLNNMASIFANACLTIVLADGSNADAGFRGLRDISSKRQATQRVVSIANPERKIVKPSSRQVWSGSVLVPWSSRAWTFQEEVCSRRVLYFAHDSVRWQCRTSR